MTNRFARNTTRWCRSCDAYRTMMLADRSRCQLCGNPWDYDPQDAADEAQAQAEAAAHDAMCEAADDRARQWAARSAVDDVPGEFPF